MQRGRRAVGPCLDPGSGFSPPPAQHSLDNFRPEETGCDVIDVHVRGSLKREKWKSQCLLMECAGWGWRGRLEGSLRRDGELFGNLCPVQGERAGEDSRSWASVHARWKKAERTQKKVTLPMRPHLRHINSGQHWGRRTLQQDRELL